jgi:Spy/CpxP family protein refolding chaperone
MNRTTKGTLGMTLLLVATIFLSSGMVVAQRFGGRDGGPMALPQRLLENLGITDVQAEQITQLREEAKSTLGALHEEQKGYRQQLKTLLESEAPNPIDVGNTVIAAHDLREEIGATQKSFRETFQSILTLEQQEALEEMRNSRRRGRRGHRGSRGPGDFSNDGF